MLNNQIDFQEYADLWAKTKIKRTLRIAKLYIKKTDKFKHKLMTHDWKWEVQNVEKMYFVNKAIHFKANKNLPLTTLFLLGKLISDQKYSKLTKKIILDNVISYNGNVYQLDDLTSQTKIRKALRTKEFNQVLDNVA